MADLAELLAGRRTLVLSGAGISTESGIPDYRGPDGRARHRAPITYQQFVRDERARRRYWARSVVGWPRMAAAEPNAGHRALTDLQRAGAVPWIVTQNVDGLHGLAGSGRVVELHGALRSVRCLGCGAVTGRAALQRRLLELNPGAADALAPHARPRAPAGSRGARPAGSWPALRPDGDADVAAPQADTFVVPGCERCGGLLKPDVVFFGENVPSAVADVAWRRVAAADALLVVGSSLAVRSAYRLVVAARDAGTPIAIVNDGPTRGDADATLKVAGRLGAVLSELAARRVGRDDVVARRQDGPPDGSADGPRDGLTDGPPPVGPPDGSADGPRDGLTDGPPPADGEVG